MNPSSTEISYSDSKDGKEIIKIEKLYDLMELRGKGWKALNIKTGKIVALKIINVKQQNLSFKVK